MEHLLLLVETLWHAILFRRPCVSPQICCWIIHTSEILILVQTAQLVKKGATNCKKITVTIIAHFSDRYQEFIAMFTICHMQYSPHSFCCIMHFCKVAVNELKLSTLWTCNSINLLFLNKSSVDMRKQLFLERLIMWDVKCIVMQDSD